MERQNRSYLQQVVAGLGVRAEMPDDCDAESELGLAIPGTTAPTTSLRERRGGVRLMCANREIGGFVLGEGSPPPEAFWPTLFQEMTVHPSLHQRVRESGRAPTRLDIAFRVSPEAVTTRSWRLIAIETAILAYPLNDSMQNTTAETLDQLLGPGIAQTAADAVAGRALGGPPSLQSWGEHLRAVTRSDGPAAAAMLLMPTFNMFPELAGACSTPQFHPACEISRNLRTIAQDDHAPLALIEIGMAEQQGNATAAIAAMQRAQSSRNRDHPALGASFALALLKFSDDYLAQARAANLPTDVAALQARALAALPYNPAYWTDVGDRYAVNYEWHSAFLFYDVAFSLPMPSAVERSEVLAARRTNFERIRRDFPNATLR
jgi:hypothetical protein